MFRLINLEPSGIRRIELAELGKKAFWPLPCLVEFTYDLLLAASHQELSSCFHVELSCHECILFNGGGRIFEGKMMRPPT